ncbi:hypothetical protein BDP27DRAFT_1428782 [Rhodocollybia butyracea]|uniref:Uncharacterized protein n=1 Tax=Rhodocollybia butyracea TaxID=206335 RepID=A0A9P5U0R8_9AGAR|nr:hypothetical protein BDP27DRAFT_1428782 [Rhodocollybia butyracea]
MSGIGNNESIVGTKSTAASLEALVPTWKRGRTSKLAEPLPIPIIPSTPSNAPSYALTMPSNISTPLLPLAALPSPITPSFHIDSDPMNIRSSANILGLEFSPEINSGTSSGLDLSPDIPTSSLWSSDTSRQSVAVPRRTFLSDSAFSQLLPSVHKTRMTESNCLENAIEFIVDELGFSTVAEFFALYLQQIPRGSDKLE